jgi:predicted PurR-regulated permease PerM
MTGQVEPRPRGAPGDTSREWRWLRTDTILLALGIGVLLWLVGPVLLVVFAGILLAVALDGVTEPVARWTGLARGYALLVVLIGLVLLLVAAGMTIVPQFIAQLGDIWDQVTALAGEAQRLLQRYPWMQQLAEGEENNQAMDAASDIAGHLATATMAVFGAVGTMLIIVIVGLFLAANPALYRRGLVKLVPPGRRARVEVTLSTVAWALRWWLLGQLISMLMLGVSTSVGLFVLGVDLWLGLGVLVALLTFIPFLGPLIAGVPVILIGFTEGLGTGLAVLALYLVIQNIEGYVVTPLIQQKAVDLPPALLIAVQILLGALFGAAGLILAAPLTAVAMVAVNLLYIEDVLGDRRALPCGPIPPA